MKLFESRCTGPPIGAGVDPPILPIRPRSRRRMFDRRFGPRSGDWKTILPGRVCYRCPARASGKIQGPAGTRGIGCATSVLADQLGGFVTESRGFGRRRNSWTLLPSAGVIQAPLPGPADYPFRLGIADRLHLSCSYGGTFSNSLIAIASLSSRFGNSSGRRRKPNCRCLRRLHAAHDVVWRLERPISVTGVFAL